MPSGSIKKAMLGLAIWWLRQVGDASMIPPTRQNDDMYSCQDLKRFGIAMIAFLGRYLVRIGFIYSTKSSYGSSCFFFKA